MDVKGLYDFSGWYLKHAKEVLQQYQGLHSKLNHNATQPQKQPVRDDLKEILITLRSMPFQVLTNEQIDLVREEGVEGFLGTVGARNLERIVKSARFDPASAASDVSEIVNSLSGSVSRIQNIYDSLSEIGGLSDEQSSFEQITIRVHFKDAAAISDVGEWKEWADEWYEIIRGVTMSVGEAPENVKVLGAHQGSVIIVLGATVAVTGALLLISNHLTKIALNTLQVANGIADFKQKLRLNKTIADGLEKAIQQSEKEHLKELLETVKENLPSPIDGEQETALKRSIDKFKKFTERGGEVDFIAPPDPEGEGDLNAQGVEQIECVRENIAELRDTREKTRLLTNHNEDDIEFEDEDLKDDEDLEE